MLRTFKILMFTAIFLGVLPVYAQDFELPLGINVPTLADYLNIKVNPDHPRPNREVNVSLSLSQADLNRSEISWFLNGEIQKSGIGEKTFTFKTGAIGTASRVSVSIETVEGQTINKEIVIRPATLDLIWNAETYSPPFYKGRALAGQRSKIRVTAIPQLVDAQGNLINPKSFVYRWKEGNKVIAGQSGIGKDVITLEGKLITRARNITVEVESLDGNSKSSGRVVIDNHDPSVLIYENHPLYGIMFNRGLDNTTLTSQEISLVAIPYFFNVLNRNSEQIEYSWTQNGRSVGLSSQRSLINFGLPSDTELVGDIIISVSAKNKENSIQSGDGSFILRLNDR